MTSDPRQRPVTPRTEARVPPDRSNENLDYLALDDPSTREPTGRPGPTRGARARWIRASDLLSAAGLNAASNAINATSAANRWTRRQLIRGLTLAPRARRQGGHHQATERLAPPATHGRPSSDHQTPSR